MQSRANRTSPAVLPHQPHTLGCRAIPSGDRFLTRENVIHGHCNIAFSPRTTSGTLRMCQTRPPQSGSRDHTGFCASAGLDEGSVVSLIFLQEPQDCGGTARDCSSSHCYMAAQSGATFREPGCREVHGRSLELCSDHVTRHRLAKIRPKDLETGAASRVGDAPTYSFCPLHSVVGRRAAPQSGASRRLPDEV